jgi:hypothetical protein
MTRSDQYKKSRAWLKTHTFAITKSLREKLESVPPENRQAYCYIQNHVLMAADNYEDEFPFIPTDVWKDKLGTGYKRFITQLKDWNELEVDTSEFRWSKNKTGRSFSYAVPLAAKENGTCIVDFHRKRIRLPRPKNKPNDAVSHFALECLSKLRVVENLVYPTPKDPLKDTDTRKARIKWQCQHIFGGDYSLHYGKKVKRLYHRVLSMPSEARCNLYHVSGFELAEYDVRTCHPVLMLKFFTDPTERSEYAKMLSGDIYTQIGNEIKIDDRDHIKNDFQRVCNTKFKSADWMANQPVFQFYYNHFPKFAVEVIFKRKDLAASLQNLEASLLVQKLGTVCREQNLFWIPMHDGFIARIDQGETISYQASKIIQDSVGISPQIECNPLY